MSPVHAIMTLHNVETNEVLWDYKATGKDLLRVVRDNIVGQEGIAAKKRVAEEREQGWEKLLKDRLEKLTPVSLLLVYFSCISLFFLSLSSFLNRMIFLGECLFPPCVSAFAL